MSRRFKKLLRVALVGRRNVGKSTLLNALYGRRRAITDSFAGLTRDILEVEIDRPPYHFLLSDTPGLDIENPGKLEEAIIRRAREYINSVDLVLLLLEAPAMAPFDYDFLKLVRHADWNTPVVYVINKIDGPEQENEAMAEFYQAGLADMIPLSAKGRWNLQTLVEMIEKQLPGINRPDWKTEVPVASQTQEIVGEAENQSEIVAEDPRASNDEMAQEYDLPTDGSGAVGLEIHNDTKDGHQTAVAEEKEEEDYYRSLHQTYLGIDVDFIESIYARRKDQSTTANSSVISDSRDAETRIALVGRPNAGKSSIFNKLLQRDVALVSEVAGTTRDTLDTILNYHGQSIRILDTAGLRKSSKFIGKDDIEFYSASRAKRAIRDARVVIHVIDATMGMTDFDKKISALIRELKRPVVLAFNKWDLIPDKHTHSTREYLDRFRFQFPHIRHLPHVFCSALSGQRVNRLIEMCLDLDRRMQIRVATGKLNQKIQLWLRRAPTSVRDLRIYYVSQVETEPPAFAFFVNKRKLFRTNLIGYYENKIRETYDLRGIPIDILIREKKPERRS